MDAHEIVVHGVQRHGESVIIDLLRKGIRQPREAAHMHPHREIVQLDTGRADVVAIPPSFDCPLARARGGLHTSTSLNDSGPKLVGGAVASITALAVEKRVSTLASSVRRSYVSPMAPLRHTFCRIH